MGLTRLQHALTHWGTCPILRPLPGGNRNQAYLIERQGEWCVAKTTRRSEAALAWLAPVHEAAEQVGLRVPRLIASEDGRLVVGGVTVERFLTGKPPEANQLKALLPRLKEFHALTRQLPQRPGFASSLQLLDQTQGGDVDLNEMPPPLVAQCRSQWRAWTNAPQSVVHGDLGLNNILVTDVEEFCLVDWDEARVDMSQFDTLALGKTLGRTLTEAEDQLLLSWEIAVCWLVEPDYARRLAERPLPQQLPTGE